jgi:metal-responsive CopG/Arc/MetJ family transcriptional regulator
MDTRAVSKAVRPYLLNIPEHLYSEIERVAKEKKLSRKAVIVHALRKMMKEHS